MLAYVFKIMLRKITSIRKENMRDTMESRITYAVQDLRQQVCLTEPE
jgi:hypothetical protein